MKERPILFSAPMVRAILDGRKTQTRRVLKTQPLDVLPMNGNKAGIEWIGLMQREPEPKGTLFHCRHGQPGDRFWVRENGWECPDRTPNMMREGADTWAPYYYDADGYGESDFEQFKEWGFKRRPSIHMPRWASRINLEITGVRVDRLQSISVADAISEGSATGQRDPVVDFKHLWESINGARSWYANPWVWVIEFKRVQ